MKTTDRTKPPLIWMTVFLLQRTSARGSAATTERVTRASACATLGGRESSATVSQLTPLHTGNCRFVQGDDTNAFVPHHETARDVGRKKQRIMGKKREVAFWRGGTNGNKCARPDVVELSRSHFFSPIRGDAR